MCIRDSSNISFCGNCVERLLALGDGGALPTCLCLPGLGSMGKRETCSATAAAATTAAATAAGKGRRNGGGKRLMEEGARVRCGFSNSDHALRRTYL